MWMGISFLALVVVVCFQSRYSMPLLVALTLVAVYFLARHHSDAAFLNAAYFSIVALSLLISIVFSVVRDSSVTRDKLHALLLCMIVFGWLLLGPMSIVSLFIFYVWTACTLWMSTMIDCTFALNNYIVIGVVQSYFLGKFLFFQTGHRYDFGTLQVVSAL